MTNLERIKNAKNAEDMVEAIHHALKVSNYYTE